MKETDSSKAVDFISKNEKEFVKVYPEVAEPLKAYRKADSDPLCKSCAKKRAVNNVLHAIALANGGSKRNIAVLDKFIGEKDSFLRMVLRSGVVNTPTSKEVEVITIDERNNCIECVCKHLSQAMVLLDEVVQGYPDHISLAMHRAKKALEAAPRNDISLKKDLHILVDTLNSIIRNSGGRNYSFFLKRANEILEDIINNKAQGTLATWKVIGHLGEAADECVLEQPELAEAIRIERLKLMQDVNYRPAVGVLLSKAVKENNR